MTETINRIPVKMDFSIASITEGIEYWLNTVILKENIVVDTVTWDHRNNVFSVTLTKGIQVGIKL